MIRRGTTWLGLVVRIDVRFNADERPQEITLTLLKPIIQDSQRYAGMSSSVTSEYEVVLGSAAMTVVARKQDGCG